MSSSQDIFSKYEKWNHLLMLIQEGGESVCKYVLHVEMGVPTEGREMYKYLQKYADDILTSKMYGHEIKILLNEDRNIDTRRLGLQLYTFIIQILDKNNKYPLIPKLRYRRNELFHMEEFRRNISEKEFDDRWNELSRLLMNFNLDLSSLQSLKHVNRLPNRDDRESLNGNLRKGRAKKFISLSEYQSRLKVILAYIFQEVVVQKNMKKW